MKRLKTYPKISLESIDDLTRVNRLIDSSESILWLECLVSSNAENVKKNNLTLGTKHSHVGNKTGLVDFYLEYNQDLNAIKDSHRSILQPAVAELHKDSRILKQNLIKDRTLNDTRYGCEIRT